MRLARLLLLAFMMMLPSVAMAQEAADWPHTIATPNGATATVYQPQAISWPDQKTLTTRMALAITPAGAKTPVLGTLEISFATVVDNATHLVTLSDSKLIASHFPTLDTAQAGQLQDRIGALLPTLQLKQVPLDAIVLSLKDLPQTAQPVAVNNDPPTIFHADRPASLVVFDGDPVMAPAGNSGLKFAVNTNWDVFQAADGTGICSTTASGCRHRQPRVPTRQSRNCRPPLAGCHRTPISPMSARLSRRNRSPQHRCRRSSSA